jgi:hypothetical protein
MRALASNTKSSYRLISLPERVTEVLKKHRMRQMEAQEAAGAACWTGIWSSPTRLAGFLDLHTSCKDGMKSSNWLGCHRSSFTMDA